MGKMYEQAVAALAGLPEADREQIAADFLELIAAAKPPGTAPQPALEALAAKARAEYAAGQTTPLDFDKL